MSEVIKGIRTQNGVAKYDYESLANKPVVDSSMSDSSNNTVKNRIIKSYVDNKAIEIIELSENIFHSAPGAEGLYGYIYPEDIPNEYQGKIAPENGILIIRGSSARYLYITIGESVEEGEIVIDLMRMAGYIDLIRKLVPKTRTIAGIDLLTDITANELTNAVWDDIESKINNVWRNIATETYVSDVSRYKMISSDILVSTLSSIVKDIEASDSIMIHLSNNSLTNVVFSLSYKTENDSSGIEVMHDKVSNISDVIFKFEKLSDDIIEMSYSGTLTSSYSKILTVNGKITSVTLSIRGNVFPVGMHIDIYSKKY